MKTVMIVDDEEDIRFVLQMALRKAGFTTMEASNGEEALIRIRASRPSAIVLDIMMPKLDGHSVNLRLKEDPLTAHIPVIVITGKGHLKELMNIREDLKVAAYLEKPFQVSQLIGKLREILNVTD